MSPIPKKLLENYLSSFFYPFWNKIYQNKATDLLVVLILEFLMKIKNKVIVVTGGGSGIGRELVLHLLEKGAKVAAADINKTTLEETKKFAGEKAKHLSTHVLDITDKPAVEQFPEEIIVYKKELSREKEEGIKDALVDMLCLSKTSRIIGSFWSSFSEVSAEIGRIPLTIGTNEKNSFTETYVNSLYNSHS